MPVFFVRQAAYMMVPTGGAMLFLGFAQHLCPDVVQLSDRVHVVRQNPVDFQQRKHERLRLLLSHLRIVCKAERVGQLRNDRFSGHVPAGDHAIALERNSHGVCAEAHTAPEALRHRHDQYPLRLGGLDNKTWCII